MLVPEVNVGNDRETKKCNPLIRQVAHKGFNLELDRER